MLCHRPPRPLYPGEVSVPKWTADVFLGDCKQEMLALRLTRHHNRSGFEVEGGSDRQVKVGEEKNEGKVEREGKWAPYGNLGVDWCVEGGLGVGGVHVSPSALVQKKNEEFNESGADSFCMQGLAVERETATSWATARAFLRMRNVFEDAV